MKLVSRAAWRARSRSTPTNITPSRGGVTIHYVGATAINDSHSNCAGRVRGIQNHHINGNGWSDIAYSLLVCAHGYVFVGRGINRRTAANGTNSGNQNWYAVCALLGGSQQPTAQMVQGIKDAVAYLRKSGGAASRVNGHRDHLSTSCPGNPLYAMVRSGTFGSGGSTTPTPPPSGGGSTTGRQDPVIGLKKGDSGEPVKALQELIKFAGYGSALGKYGVDGDYGPGTAEGLRLARKYVGSAAKTGWGDRVTGHAYAQLIAAVAKRQR